MSSGKILIVDDDRDIRLGLGTRLRASGFEVAFAEDGMGAIADLCAAELARARGLAA